METLRGISPTSINKIANAENVTGEIHRQERNRSYIAQNTEELIVILVNEGLLDPIIKAEYLMKNKAIAQSLSPREKQVAEMIRKKGEKQTRKVMAQKLKMSKGTISTHMQSIKIKRVASENLVRKNWQEKLVGILDSLTPEEIQSLDSLVKDNGKQNTNKEIAVKKRVSTNTVRAHFRNIHIKFGLHERADVIIAYIAALRIQAKSTSGVGE